MRALYRELRDIYVERAEKSAILPAHYHRGFAQQEGLVLQFQQKIFKFYSGLPRGAATPPVPHGVHTYVERAEARQTQ